MPTKPTVETVTITVDGQPVEAFKGEMVIAAAERAGAYIPRFCWHPRMKPVGMCRMCVVEIKGPRGFALQPACYVPVAEGQEILTQSDKTKKAQDGILEFLLVNHPLDCPVCDKGGECPLQDQTIAFGPGETRFVEEKRHFEKPIPVSDLVFLDRERCIICARCTRFADEVAGDPLIQIIDRGNASQINTFPDEPFASYFSGNTVQICPVGALTAAPYRFKARPWDLEQVESTCTSCSVGCRVAVQSSTNQLTRYLGLDSEPVNHSWLCDKGRFDFEAVNDPDRITHPLVRKAGELVEVSWGEALDAAAAGLSSARDLHGAGSLAILGGSRLANEDAYAWAKLAKGVLGTDNVDAQLDDGLPAELVLSLPRATIDDACWADTVILLAPDLKEELPVLYLRLREAVLDHGVKIVELSPRLTGMTRHAAVTLPHRPGEAPAVVAALTASADATDAVAGVPVEFVNSARALLGAGRSVVVVLGRPSLSESADYTAQAAASLHAALPGATFLPALRRSNVLGALDMGLAPGLLPGRTTLADAGTWYADIWGSVPAARGLDAAGIARAAAEGKVHGLVLLGADPLADLPDRALARRALSGAGFVVAVDTFRTASVDQADVVLPVAVYAERGGTTTNIEGRVSRLGQKIVPPGVCWPDWMIASELAFALGTDLGFDSLEAITDEIERMAPSHTGLTRPVLASRDHRDGVLVPLAAPIDPGPALGDGEPVLDAEADVEAMGDGEPVPQPGIPADRRPPTLAPGTYSPPQTAPAKADGYSLRLVTARVLYDAGTLVQHSPHLAPLAATPVLRVHPSELARLGIPSGATVRVKTPKLTLSLAVEATTTVPKGAAYLPFNLSGEGAADLVDSAETLTDVRLESLA